MRQKRQYVTDMEDKLSRQWERILNEKKHRLQLLAGRLDGLSPLKRLSGGFAYVADEKGMRVDRAEMVKPGDVLEITWRDGSVRAEVTKDE